MSQGPSTETRQDYLKIILDLMNKTIDGDGFISNKEIASAFHVQPPSVSGILEKLQAAGLVEWRKRKGVRLTVKGLRHAMKVLEAYKIAESFLAIVLKANDSAMNHRIACKMEHILIDEPRLAVILNDCINDARHHQQPEPALKKLRNVNDS